MTLVSNCPRMFKLTARNVPSICPKPHSYHDTHAFSQVVVYAKTPSQQRGNRTLLCFPSEYTEYVFCVNASGRKWDISKRFKDFIKFEAKLIKHFSEEDLAGREPLPEKNYFLSNSPSYVEHRRWRLEMYINSLAHCPVVAHSEIFKDFLGCDQGQRSYGNEVLFVLSRKAKRKFRAPSC